MIEIIRALYRAWGAGEIIRNPEKWKSGGDATTYVMIILTSIFTLINYAYPASTEFLSEELKVLIGTLIVTGLGIVHVIITRVTTKKEVGLRVLTAKTKEDDRAPKRRNSDQENVDSSSRMG